MNQKILFISSMAFTSSTGGSQCSKRNLESIIELFGTENTIQYSLQSFNIKNINLTKICKAIINTLQLRMNGITKEVEQDIISTIKENNVEFVFVDSSLNGSLIKLIKKETDCYVLAFFHNCEFSLISQEMRNGRISIAPRLLSSFFNEKLTIIYADITIGLNERDSSLIEKYYNRKLKQLIPISLKDNFFDNASTTSSSKSKKLLFVGSKFYPNIHAIRWFIKNVMPYVDAQLDVVGKDIDQIGIKTTDKIRIFSNVPDLEPFYLDADIVIAPLLKGAGMKVKVAEAMMYDKPVLGTTEAFQGYHKVKGMYEANTAQEFIDIINDPELNLATETRINFINHYSFNSTLNLFKKCFPKNE